MASDNYPYDGGDDDDDDLATCQRRLELLRGAVRALTARVRQLERERPVFNRMYLMRDGKPVRRKETT